MLTIGNINKICLPMTKTCHFLFQEVKKLYHLIIRYLFYLMDAHILFPFKYKIY